jgi:CPA2 family monovalent cation:H+ antiporter-2
VGGVQYLAEPPAVPAGVRGYAGPGIRGESTSRRRSRPTGEALISRITLGLSFSLPQIRALRDQVFALVTGQVALTTAAVGIVAWLAGMSPAAAFVVGAVFAQSSTTIISRQLNERGEDDSRHGRLGTALSVFQDVTAVPFVVVVPALGLAVGAQALAASLRWALARALLTFTIVFVAGRWMLWPLFHAVAVGRSAELFTLTVLLVSLAAGWTTGQLGLSMAFGAVLAGMHRAIAGAVGLMAACRRRPTLPAPGSRIT